MVDLIYHDPSDRTGISPFDKTIRDITEDEVVLIACPYIEPDYFLDLTEQTDEWFLLTDVGELLSIHGQAKRKLIHKFLIKHRDRVRHVTDLHAKVVIGGNRALVGSANLTTKGLTGRTEMSVLLDKQDAIDELTEWFETVWSIYDPPEIDRIEEYIETALAALSPTQNESSVIFSPRVSPGTASLMQSTTNDVVMDAKLQESHEKLVQRVSKAPSPDWIDSYFNLIGHLISETKLSSDDPRLSMSLPQAGTIPVTINNRYVLVAFRGKRSRTEFIVPRDVEGVSTYIERADRTGRFDPIYNEKKSEAPWFMGFDGLPHRVVDDQFRNAWINAAITEMERAKKSPYKRYHESVVYKAVRDRNYRKKVIREAFSQE